MANQWAWLQMGAWPTEGADGCGQCWGVAKVGAWLMVWVWPAGGSVGAWPVMWAWPRSTRDGGKASCGGGACPCPGVGWGCSPVHCSCPVLQEGLWGFPEVGGSPCVPFAPLYSIQEGAALNKPTHGLTVSL